MTRYKEKLLNKAVSLHYMMTKPLNVCVCVFISGSGFANSQALSLLKLLL